MPPQTSSRAGQPSLHFAPRDRLRKRFEFRRLRNQGRRVHTASFVVQVAPSEVERTRLGLTVPRQVGNAVRRNRVKRLLREVFRNHRGLFPPTADLVVIAKGKAAPDSFAAVLHELQQASAAMHAAVRRAQRSRPPAPPGVASWSGCCSP